VERQFPAASGAGAGGFALSTRAAQKIVVVKIISAASGGGKYNGRIWIVPATGISASGNLATTDFGTDPGSNNALVLNLDELAQSTHDLTTGTPKVTHFIGVIRGTSTTGLPVVVINGSDWAQCS
jgi:hypothetical protein